MQEDGNLVLFRTHFGRALWASNTNQRPVNHTIMQADGNLVAYSSGGVPFWNTGTYGHPGAWVLLKDDGNLVVYDHANNPLWASNTVQDLSSPTIQYTDGLGYEYDETSESWKQLCTDFPSFAALQWGGYSTNVVEGYAIDGHPVVIQLWKGLCQKFLGLPQFPGGIGAEVGVYRRIRGRTLPTSLSFLPPAFANFILSKIETLIEDQLWWAFPELGTKIEFTLTNPVTNQTFFSAGAEVTYWLNKWMSERSYAKYQSDQGNQTPSSYTDYRLDYRINNKSYPPW